MLPVRQKEEPMTEKDKSEIKRLDDDNEKKRKLKIMIALAGGILILLIVLVAVLRVAFD